MVTRKHFSAELDNPLSAGTLIDDEDNVLVRLNSSPQSSAALLLIA